MFKWGLAFYGEGERHPLTTDEFYGLFQIGIVFAAFLAVILIFVYLAYEKPSA